MKHKCLCYNKNYKRKLDKNLNKQFFNTYTFSNHDINKFISLLQIGILQL